MREFSLRYVGTALFIVSRTFCCHRGIFAALVATLSHPFFFFCAMHKQLVTSLLYHVSHLSICFVVFTLNLEKTHNPLIEMVLHFSNL